MAFLDDEVVWSDWWGQYDPDWVGEQYRELEARGIALGNEIVVFLRSRCDYAASTVAAYFDDVEVTQEGEEPGPGPGGDELGRIADALERAAQGIERIAAVVEASAVEVLATDASVAEGEKGEEWDRFIEEGRG